jgi:hypothetical protein
VDTEPWFKATLRVWADALSVDHPLITDDTPIYVLNW